jgi:hypothetical protein
MSYLFYFGEIPKVISVCVSLYQRINVVVYVIIYVDTYVDICMTTSTIFVVIIMNHPVYNTVAVNRTGPNDV